MRLPVGTELSVGTELRRQSQSCMLGKSTSTSCRSSACKADKPRPFPSRGEVRSCHWPSLTCQTSSLIKREMCTSRLPETTYTFCKIVCRFKLLISQPSLFHVKWDKMLVLVFSSRIFFKCHEMSLNLKLQRIVGMLYKFIFKEPESSSNIFLIDYLSYLLSTTLVPNCF
jgi:hypothetical protein